MNIIESLHHKDLLLDVYIYDLRASEYILCLTDPVRAPPDPANLKNGNTDIIQQNVIHLANLKAYMAAQAAKNPPELSNFEQF